jgi:hypothetical protein
MVAQKHNRDAGGIQMGKRPRTCFSLPAMTQFDALRAHKYAHIYEQRAIAD